MTTETTIRQEATNKEKNLPEILHSSFLHLEWITVRTQGDQAIPSLGTLISKRLPSELSVTLSQFFLRISGLGTELIFLIIFHNSFVYMARIITFAVPF